MENQKLTQKEIVKLNEMGFKNLKTEDEAKKKLIEHLKQNDVDGVEEEELKDLIGMAELFEVKDNDDDENEEEVDDADFDEEEEEVKPVKKSVKKPIVVEEEDEDTDDEELEDVDLEEDEDEEEAPAKKSVVKEKPKKSATPKIEEEDEEDYDGLAEEIEEAEEKGTLMDIKAGKKKEEPVVKGKRGRKKKEQIGVPFDAENEEHAEIIEVIKMALEEKTGKEFNLKVLQSGFTARYIGANGLLPIFSYDKLKVIDGKLWGEHIYFNQMKDREDLLEYISDDYEEKEIGMFRTDAHPSMKKVSQDELFDLIQNSEFVEISIERAKETDNKMGKKRASFEDNLSKDKTDQPKKEKSLSSEIKKDLKENVKEIDSSIIGDDLNEGDEEKMFTQDVESDVKHKPSKDKKQSSVDPIINVAYNSKIAPSIDSSIGWGYEAIDMPEDEYNALPEYLRTTIQNGYTQLVQNFDSEIMNFKVPPVMFGNSIKFIGQFWDKQLSNFQKKVKDLIAKW